jgi:hypothetical protein
LKENTSVRIASPSFRATNSALNNLFLLKKQRVSAFALCYFLKAIKYPTLPRPIESKSDWVRVAGPMVNALDQIMLARLIPDMLKVVPAAQCRVETVTHIVT